MACRVRVGSDQLIRVRAERGGLTTITGGGRGAWLGPARACLERTHAAQGLARALRVEVNAAGIARLMESWPTVPLTCPHESG